MVEIILANGGGIREKAKRNAAQTSPKGRRLQLEAMSPKAVERKDGPFTLDNLFEMNSPRFKRMEEAVSRAAEEELDEPWTVPEILRRT